MYPSCEGNAGIPEYIFIISNTKRFVKVLKKRKVGYEFKDWNCRAAERGEIDAF